MATYKDIKKAYIRNLVMWGSPNKEDYGTVPNHLKEKWQRKLCVSEMPRLQTQPRLLNRFMLGADPEFIFVHSYPRRETDDFGIVRERERTVRVDAASVGLKTGLAFGADQNGRLIELRPRPSRSCLEVLGSIWAELKWMGLLYPDTLKYQWQCGAFLFGDGLGGHIHFGRKRPTRDEEVRALDRVGQLLYNLGAFPKEEWARRQEGDERGQRYGRWGDIRPQVHGYEYRTLPSWLDSPWLAYLCMTLTKLAVYNPKLVENWNNKNKDHITHILGYYKGLDDDAAIALKGLEVHGMPVHRGGDFKPRWGIDFKEHTKGITVIPGSISPQSSEISELFDFVTKGTPLTAKQVEPTWKPLTVPEGFSPILDRTEVTRVAGLGEILTGLCDSREYPIEFFPAGDHRGISLGRGLCQMLSKDWQEQLKKVAPDLYVQPDRGEGHAIGVGDSWRNVRRIQRMKKVLTSGIFPIWKIREIGPETLQTWMGKRTIQVETKGRTKVLVQPSA